MLTLTLSSCNYPTWYLFWDDFDNGDIKFPPTNWEDGLGTTYYYQVDTDDDPDRPGYSLRLWGPQEFSYGTFSALKNRLRMGGIQPNYVTFLVRGTPLDEALYGAEESPRYADFLLRGPRGILYEEFPIISFYITYREDPPASMDQAWINGVMVYSGDLMPWHQVEYKNIDWDTNQFDAYIDGVLVGPCMEFQYTATEFNMLDVFNFDPADVYFDDIYMRTDPNATEPHCDPAPPAPPPAPPPLETTPTYALPTDTPTSTPVVFRATAKVNANCRAGPGTGYNETGFLPEGFTAQVEGRNDQGTWLYLQTPNRQGYCWASKSALVVDFDISILQVVSAPPLPPTAVPPTSIEQTEPGCCTVKMPSSGELQCACPCPQGAEPGEPCTP
jgi:hypothetical protein